MESSTKKFLSENAIPDYVINLLELYGITFIEDLETFDQEDIECIEELICSGKMFRGIKLSDNPRKFLGIDSVDASNFTFREIDRKKLLSINTKKANINCKQEDSKGITLPDQLLLKVVGQDGSAVKFKVNKTAPMSKLKNAYCERVGISAEGAKFLFDGVSIRADATPESLEMQDDDMIDVFINQIGGYLKYIET